MGCGSWTPRDWDTYYLVELEYEDHTEVGSALEHDILPNQDFTVRRFSHH